MTKALINVLWVFGPTLLVLAAVGAKDLYQRSAFYRQRRVTRHVTIIGRFADSLTAHNTRWRQQERNNARAAAVEMRVIPVPRPAEPGTPRTYVLGGHRKTVV